MFGEKGREYHSTSIVRKSSGIELSDPCIDYWVSSLCFLNCFLIRRIVRVPYILPFFPELTIDDPWESVHDHCLEKTPI